MPFIRRQRSSRRRARGGPRRKTDWIQARFLFSEDPISSGTAFFFDVTDLTDLEDHNDQMTVVRIVGDLLWQQPLLSMNSATVLRWGIMRTPEDEGTGIIMDMSPINSSDLDYEDWLTLGTEYFNSEGTNGSAGVGEIVIRKTPVDLRVMRKLEGLQKIVIAAQIESIFNGPVEDIILSMHLRVLVKLV